MERASRYASRNPITDERYQDTTSETDDLWFGQSPLLATTWEASMVFTCVADRYGYVPHASYHAISERAGNKLQYIPCPHGYDASALRNSYSVENATYNNFSVNVQSLSCEASSGTAQLRFRDSLTAPWDASTLTVEELVNALQDLPSVGTLHLVNASMKSDLFCSATAPRTVTLGFLTEIGTIPALEVVNSALSGGAGAVTVTVVRNGAASAPALKQCSGHGYCNRDTGECICRERWSSSDGFGNLGTRRDCGFYNVL